MDDGAEADGGEPVDGGAVNAPDRTTLLRFSPDRRLTAAYALAAVVVAGAALAATDPAGRLLLVGAGLVLFAYVVTDLVFAPRITAGPDGLVLNAPFARTRVSWAEVESIRTDTRQRLGLRSSVLEIDTGTVLALFSRRALGADPGAVAALLGALDPRGGAAGGGAAGGGSEGGGAGHDEGEDGGGHRS